MRSTTVKDARGISVAPSSPRGRIVCLYPSGTETLYDLGLASRIVGRTSYCPLPDDGTRPAAIGGTTNPDVAKIREARPDLVIANIDENRREDVEALESFAPVYVTHPVAVADVPGMIEGLGAVTGADPGRARPLADGERRRLRERAGRAVAPRRALVFIWRDPGWTLGGPCYGTDLLRLCGFDNVFGRDPRPYFRPEAPAVRASRPDAILLPDEPYRFSSGHVPPLLDEFPEFRDLPIRLFDGSLLTWHGTRTARALDMLPDILA
jgi:ABC-type Fe3+-hydroxamate transport system substrate-binding protein